MSNRIHSLARTTPRTRQDIKESTLPQHELAKLYNVSRLTIRKWQRRDSVEDASHCPHQLNTTLSAAQEEIVIALRETLLLPLDDLTVVVKVRHAKKTDTFNSVKLELGSGDEQDTESHVYG